MTRKIMDHIVVDSQILFGKPLIEGTRVPVDLIVGKVAGGMSVEELIAEYELTREQVLAALRYAAKLVASEEIASP